MKYDELTQEQKDELVRTYFCHGDDFHEWYDDIVDAVIRDGKFEISRDDIKGWFDDMDEDAQRVFLDLPNSPEPESHSSKHADEGYMNDTRFGPPED